MPRIFASLAVANVLLLLLTGVFGLLGAGVWRDRHVLLAVLTLLFSAGVQVLAFTYLTVTGKVAAQAVHLGRLDPGTLAATRSIKKSLSRGLGGLVVTMVLAVATGASAWRLGGGVYHFPSALLSLAVHVFVLTFEYNLLARNARIVASTLAEYSARRGGQAAAAGGPERG